MDHRQVKGVRYLLECSIWAYNATMVHSRQPQIDVLRRVNVKGRARFIDNSAARNLENAIQKKTQSEVILRQLGLTPEKSLVDKVTELLELSQTLDALNPVAVSPETSAAFIEARTVSASR